MNPKIKFSHRYSKLIRTESSKNGYLVKEAKLLEVISVLIKNISKEFLDYDTDDGKYELPKKGNFLMLIFQKSKYDIFTTMRRYTPEKYVYYKLKIGQVFDIEIMEDI
jgi:hypothetical protein